MRELDDIKADIISSVESIKAEMESAGVTPTSDGNMTSEDFAKLQARVSSELEPISDELGQMLNE